MAVVKQIMNRRQAVVINNIDPEILTEAKLSADGFIKNDDYASASTGGVLKISTSYGVGVASTGNLTGAARTADQYISAPGTLIISKGTLEAAIVSVIENMLKGVANDGGNYDSAETGTTWTFLLRKAEGGPSLEAVTMTPPTPPTP